jgi:putative tryptophan/tyrosine transport system substrate-binding protein
MRRRDLIAALGATVAAWPSDLLAQRMYRVGLLFPGAPPTDKLPQVQSVLRGLAKAGYLPGKNLTVEGRGAEGHVERLPGLLAELVAAKVDVIITTGYPAALAARDGTTLPVVAMNSGDPVGTGLVASLARPGGHLTGISDVSAELTPKRMELLKSVAPGLERIGILWNDADNGMQLRAKASEAGAKTMAIIVDKVAIRGPGDFDKAFGVISDDKPGALLVIADVLTIANSKRIVDYAMAHKLPAIFEVDAVATMGGLLAYGPDQEEMSERIGALVNRVLKGTPPAELPFEQPTRFKLVVNLKTAKALGVIVPATVLAIADEVVE